MPKYLHSLTRSRLEPFSEKVQSGYLYFWKIMTLFLDVLTTNLFVIVNPCPFEVLLESQELKLGHRHIEFTVLHYFPAMEFYELEDPLEIS